MTGVDQPSRGATGLHINRVHIRVLALICAREAALHPTSAAERLHYLQEISESGQKKCVAEFGTFTRLVGIFSKLYEFWRRKGIADLAEAQGASQVADIA